MSTAEMWKTALAESEKYEMERSYGVTAEGNYDFKERQEAYYVELLCRMYGKRPNLGPGLIWLR